MRTEYRRDLHHNYLILSEGRDPDPAAYPVRMLLGNEIPGLLRCELRQIDRKLLFYYETTSRQPLTELLEYRPLDQELLTRFLSRLMKTLGETAGYLLRPDGLVLQPELIFLDAAAEQVWFCYYPGCEESFQTQLRTLAEYFLPRLPHRDRGAVFLGYSLYQKSVEGELTEDAIRKLLHEAADAGRKPEPETETKASDAERTEAEPEAAFRLEAVPQARPEEAEQRKKAAAFFGYFSGISGKIRERKRKRQLKRQEKRLRRETYRVEVEERDPLSWLAGDGTETDFDAAGSDREKSMRFGTGAEDAEREVVLRREEEQTASLRETELLTEDTAGGGPVLLYLVPQDGSAEPAFCLQKDYLLIGKEKTAADLLLEGAAVSRIHAKIVRTEDGFSLQDLNSRNGTFINGCLLESGESRLLREGDEIRFADQGFRVQRGSSRRA